MKQWSIVFLLLSASCRPAEESAPTPAPVVEPVGFANPDLLIETDWLAEHAGDRSVRIVDARAAEDYEAGHIPGAIHIAREDTYDPEAEIRATVGPPEQIASLFGPKGIDEYAHVVLYDKGVATRAARIFWTLEYYGHPNVSVLNGGFDKWQAEAREVTTEVPEVAPVTFTVQRNASALTTGIGSLEISTRPTPSSWTSERRRNSPGRTLAPRGAAIFRVRFTSSGPRTTPPAKCRFSNPRWSSRTCTSRRALRRTSASTPTDRAEAGRR